MSRPWSQLYDQAVAEPLGIPAVCLPDLLTQRAVEHPDWVALTAGESDTTYEQLSERVNRFANALAAHGIERGDRVALVLPNSPVYVIAAYGAMKIGAIVVNAGVMARGPDLARILEHTGARIVVTLDVFLRGVLGALPLVSVEQLVVHSALGMERKLDLAALERPPLAFAELLAGHPASEPSAAGRPDDVALLQLTGGTTRNPRAVALTHRNIVANVTQIRSCLRAPEGENRAAICLLPFFHAFGFTICLQLSVVKGYRMVLVPRFDPLSVVPLLRLVDKYRPVSFPAVPALWAVLVKHAAAYEQALSAVEMPSSGGAALAPWVQDRYHALTGRRIIEAYGLSEAPTTHLTPMAQRFRPGSIGIPLPDTDAKIVDLETGTKDCASGEVGELVVKGPQVMRGYWQAEQSVETPATMRDGWLRTGDLARMDAEGYFHIVDRKDDLIITSGFNVCPSDVEAVLAAHPAVDDAVVIGIPDKIRGQAIEALVVLAEGAAISVEQLLSHCHEHLIDYQVPRTIKLTDAIPKSPVGTPLRRVLKQARAQDMQR